MPWVPVDIEIGFVFVVKTYLVSATKPANDLLDMVQVYYCRSVDPDKIIGWKFLFKLVQCFTQMIRFIISAGFHIFIDSTKETDIAYIQYKYAVPDFYLQTLIYLNLRWMEDSAGWMVTMWDEKNENWTMMNFEIPGKAVQSEKVVYINRHSLHQVYQVSVKKAIKCVKSESTLA